jgi:hypothetical protein
MFNHEPPGYHCPFCILAAGGENDFNLYASRPLSTPPTPEQRTPYAEKLRTYFGVAT